MLYKLNHYNCLKGKLIRLAIFILLAMPGQLTADDAPVTKSTPRLPHGIVVRSTENLTQGGWVWIVNKCHELGIKRIDVLVKQDEDGFKSRRTGRMLQSGELLVALPEEKTAEGWENSDWLEGMIEKAKEFNIEIWAWWPVFHDAQMAEQFPAHTYITGKKEVMVDPSVPEIQRRQEALIGKLLETYDFNGISLDWIRYNSWTDGMRGPLAQKFQLHEDRQLTPETLDDEYYKAQWFQIRASALTTWMSGLVRNWRQRDPSVKWGAFLLPWQFTEVNQDYRTISRSGLDFMQPMAYWDNWGFPPEWVGETLLSRTSWLRDGTMYWPVLDMENSDEQILKAAESLPSDNIQGISWFVYGSWEAHTFEKLKRIMSALMPANQMLKDTPAVQEKVPPSILSRRPVRLTEPKKFSIDANVWSVVCLAELYKRSALPEQSLAPVVPVLAFHRFADEKKGVNENLWFTSAEYLEGLFGFVRNAGFNVIPLSQLQAYLISGDTAMLPSRPIVLTIDDGSISILKYFYPAAKKYEYPFTISLVTGWTAESDEKRFKTVEYKKEDGTLIWPEINEMEGSGLVEFVSHTHDLHYWAAEQEGETESGPAMTTRKYLPEQKRQETLDEYRQRIYQGLLRSRQVLRDQLGTAPSVLTWPYGAYNDATRDMAAMSGFSHFLLFKDSTFAFYRADAENIPRVSVTQADEYIPLRFPDDKEEAQRWWLAFLRIARSAASPSLISAALDQLAPEASYHPEAEISRAALEYLRGESALAMQRIKVLRAMYPHDADVHESIDSFLAQLRR